MIGGMDRKTFCGLALLLFLPSRTLIGARCCGRFLPYHRDSPLLQVGGASSHWSYSISHITITHPGPTGTVPCLPAYIRTHASLLLCSLQKKMQASRPRCR